MMKQIKDLLQSFAQAALVAALIGGPLFYYFLFQMQP
jgi:ABC-type Fe3+-siderophore transport system permease subunit